MSLRNRTGRLAPSPTGALHLGNIRTFMVAWLQMRSVGGTLRLRIEDLDHPKHKAGAAEQIIEDLQWLGFDWDGSIVWQSQRQAQYCSALQSLVPRLYRCTCTRADILGAQSAPHPGEVLRYSGHCRRLLGQELWSEEAAPKAWRFALNANDDGRFTDAFAGVQTQTAKELTGDFVIARGNEPSYALAVVVDDAEMGVTDVVRADDILPATPAQVVLYQTLGLTLPTFYHLPLVVGKDALRLAKRHGDTRIAAYREAGISSGRILSALARSCGWLTAQDSVSRLEELLPYFSFDTLSHHPFIWDESFL
ncbi:MAG: glutamate--tRNA ligase family protein [Kiritimatiellia bacterium]